MRTKISDRENAIHGLWVITPDHPTELPLLWLVHGEPDDTGGSSITIPIPMKHLPALVRVLGVLTPDLFSGLEES